MASVDFLPILAACHELEEKLENETVEEEKQDHITNYLEHVNEISSIKFPEFNKDFQWLNTKRQLRLDDLKGKIVLLDFFTYCCLNCLHLLPYLKSLEEKFSINDGLVIIGVHSAKFDNERILENVKNAVLRYEINHPVVNDSQGCLWNELGIPCWPTIIILGPMNQVLFELIGENHKHDLELIIDTSLQYFKSNNSISSHSLPISLLKDTICNQQLSFPSKICFNEHTMCLAISDTGNHRIIVTSVTGNVLYTIGGIEAGLVDGDFETARFHSPHGVAWFSPEILYVADTGNHVIRMIDLTRKQVTIVAGTGQQGNEKIGGKQGNLQALNSPWDICFGPSVGCSENNVLYIAMAGLHQIWALFLKDGNWFKNINYSAGTCVAVAGSGNEENRNNNYPMRASFAQPSGICFVTFNNQPALIIADSESSSIRVLNLMDGTVKGIVGGDKNPLNLFAFGDNDGTGVDVRLQHPLGITWDKEEGYLYVCDSYNHKIKMINLMERSCVTIAGKDKPKTTIRDLFITKEFSEPDGLDVCTTRKELYIVDTNHHSITTIDLMNGSASDFHLSWEKPSSEESVVDGNQLDNISKFHIVKVMEDTFMTHNSVLKIQLNLQMESGLKLTEEARHSWRVRDCSNAFEIQNHRWKGNFTSLFDQPTVEIKTKGNEVNNYKNPVYIHLEVTVFFCDQEKKCYMRTILFRIPVHIGDTENGEDIVLLSLKISS